MSKTFGETEQNSTFKLHKSSHLPPKKMLMNFVGTILFVCIGKIVLLSMLFFGLAWRPSHRGDKKKTKKKLPYGQSRVFLGMDPYFMGI